MTHYALMLIVQSFATLSQKVFPLVTIPTLKLSLSPGNLYLNSAGNFLVERSFSYFIPCCRQIFGP